MRVFRMCVWRVFKESLNHDSTRPEVFYLNVGFHHKCFLVILESFSKKYSVEHSWHESVLTLLQRRSLSYRNQSIDLLCKSMDSFVYVRDQRHERVKDPVRCLWWSVLAKMAHRKVIVSVFIDVSKGFDSIHHDSVAAKRHT